MGPWPQLILPHKETCGNSGGIFIGHYVIEGRSSWHLVGRGQTCCYQPCSQQDDLPTIPHPTPNKRIRPNLSEILHYWKINHTEVLRRDTQRTLLRTMLKTTVVIRTWGGVWAGSSIRQSRWRSVKQRGQNIKVFREK